MGAKNPRIFGTGVPIIGGADYPMTPAVTGFPDSDLSLIMCWSIIMYSALTLAAILLARNASHFIHVLHWKTD